MRINLPSSAPADDIASWALERLGLPAGEAQIEPLAGDASSRRYFRLRGAGSPLILVQAATDGEKNHEFLQVRNLLDRLGVRVPRLVAADLALGALLLEDLGDELLLPRLTAASADLHYRHAFEVLHRLAQWQPGEEELPLYSRELLAEELARFPQWFVGQLLRHSLTGAERELVAAVGDLLLDSALAQPRVLVHRDFHSRNLMLPADGSLAVIDFQDAVYGPVSYDLVSLLRDCYIRWPAQRVRDWALAYRRESIAGGLLEPVPEEQFLRWFDLMGLQRHLKVLGTFARLHLRDNKPGYLGDLPLVIAYVREVLAAQGPEYPVLAALGEWFEGVMVPLIERQPWQGAVE